MTHEKRKTGKTLNDYSVAWLHEGVIDPKFALDLMAKAGYNTLAHASALTKISGTGRDFEHMSGLTRGATVVASHAALHYPTSSKPLTPLDLEFHKEAKPTNKEMLKEIREREDIGNFRKIVSQIHSQDLQDYYNYVNPKEFVQIYLDLIRERLVTEGYSDNEIALYLTTTHRIRDEDLYKIIKDQNMLVRITDSLEEFEKSGKLTAMHKVSYKNSNIYQHVSRDFFTVFSRLIYSIPKVQYENPDWTTLTEDTFITVFEKLYTMESLSKALGESKEKEFTRILAEYAGIAYTSNLDTNTELDTERIKNLFEEVKQIGLQADKDYCEPNSYFLYSSNYSHSKKLAMVFTEVFGQKPVIPAEEKPILEFPDIDLFFQENNETMTGEYFSKFLEKVYTFLNRNAIDDENRLVYINYIYDKIGELNPHTSTNLLSLLENPETSANEELTPEMAEMNMKLIRLNMKLLTGFTLFKYEQSENKENFFYDYMRKVMEECDIDATKLSLNQLLNLSQGFFITNHTRQNRKFYFLKPDSFVQFPWDNISIKISDDRAIELPFFKELVRRSGSMHFKDLREVAEYIDGPFVSNYKRWVNEGEVNFFSDDLYELVIGRGIRNSFAQALADPILDEEIAATHAIIEKHFPKSSTKDVALRELQKRYLKSGLFTFEQKLDFLENHFYSLGPEGMVLLTDQIHTYPEYLTFRQRMNTRFEQELNGSKTVNRLAVGEVLSSGLVKGFERLFKTADTSKKQEETTDFIKYWLHTYVSNGNHIGAYYNEQKKKFEVDQEGTESFHSVSDIFTYLHDLTPLERFSLIQKALTDEDGALTSSKNRIKLGNLAVNALSLEKGFMTTALKSICRKIDPTYGSFPLARMISPLLFKAYDVSYADLTALLNNRVFSDSRENFVYLKEMMSKDVLEHVLRSETRELVEYGHVRHVKPDGLFAELKRESDMQYAKAREALKTLIPSNENSNGKTIIEGLNPSTDAVLTGMAAIGAPVVRGFQLARQFYSFSPPLDRRLDNFYDQNPGLNSLLFWENLVRLAEKDTRLKNFLENELVSLDETLGVGSLYTTKSALIKDSEGDYKKIVIKMLNPNAEAFVDKTHEEALKIFDEVERIGSRKDRKYTAIARFAEELSHEWCKRDIRDETYKQDDANFRKTVNAFNEAQKNEPYIYYAPDNYYLSRDIKMETQAEGITLNKFLYSDADIEEKRNAVKNYSKFFFSLLEAQNFAEEGSEYKLILSNPTVGNCLVSKTGGIMVSGIIDRNMYLRLAPEDIAVMRPLLEGDYTQFVNLFLKRVFDINEREGVKKGIDMARLGLNLTKEDISQRMRGRKDNFALFRTILKSLQDAGLKVPLELRLTIGNIESMKKLCERYDISQNDLKT